MCPACGYPHHWGRHHEAFYAPPPWAAQWYPYGAFTEPPYGWPQAPSREEQKAGLERAKARLEADLARIDKQLQEL